RSIPCLLNKAPSGGLYTPAERRVRQADCHHLYNYESGFHYPNSRDTLSPEPKLNKELKVQNMN
ncbi:MAG TPA: hypothetical protein VFI29_07120, partial [Hanamia sp.]|nr:hypothetical protein [Hanamia sp.]